MYSHCAVTSICTKYVDGAEVVNKDEDKENPSLSEIVDAVQEAGYKKIILKPFEDQIQVDNKFYINDIWPCSNGIDIESRNLIKGRYLTEEELMSNEKVAIIGFGLERLVEEKNGERYIKIFNEEKAKKLIEELSLELTKSDQNPNKIVKEGIRWLYGNEGTLRNEKRALDYFEQAAALDYYLGYYWAGVACEKIALTVKRKTDQASWQQRALNHYQNAMKKSYYKAYARSSWLYRKFNQHNEANYTWNEFLSESSKLEKLDNETCKWIIKWADNWGNKNKDLPDSPIWKKHGKLLISLSDKKNAPKGFAKKNISKKTGSVDIINFAIALFIIFVFIGIYIYFFR